MLVADRVGGVYETVSQAARSQLTGEFRSHGRKGGDQLNQAPLDRASRMAGISSG